MTCLALDEGIEQTPTEFIDYTIDWAKRGIGTDQIASQTFTASSPDFTISNASIGASPSTGAANQATTFWLTGGQVANIYEITNTVTTVAGRIMQETIDYNCIQYRKID